MSERLDYVKHRLDQVVIELNKRGIDVTDALTAIEKDTDTDVREPEIKNAEYLEGLHDYLVLHHILGVENVTFESLLEAMNQYPGEFLSHASDGEHRKPVVVEPGALPDEDEPADTIEEVEVADAEVADAAEVDSKEVELTPVVEPTEPVADNNAPDTLVVDDSPVAQNPATADDEVSEESSLSSGNIEEEVEEDVEEEPASAKADVVTSQRINDVEFALERKGYVREDVDSALDALGKALVHFEKRDVPTEEDEATLDDLIQGVNDLDFRSVGGFSKGYSKSEVNEFMARVKDTLGSFKS